MSWSGTTNAREVSGRIADRVIAAGKAALLLAANQRIQDARDQWPVLSGESRDAINSDTSVEITQTTVRIPIEISSYAKYIHAKGNRSDLVLRRLLLKPIRDGGLGRAVARAMQTAFTGYAR